MFLKTVRFIPRLILRVIARVDRHGFDNILGTGGIAPESTRSLAEALLPGKSCAAFLATKANIPIIPIVYADHHRLQELQLNMASQ
ncbi:MAG: hypothetical protein GY943_37460 [Chloroflexi bacterium]|nr:hypothetical protein [Chloroflexota bacterium]